MSHCTSQGNHLADKCEVSHCTSQGNHLADNVRCHIVQLRVKVSRKIMTCAQDTDEVICNIGNLQVDMYAE